MVLPVAGGRRQVLMVQLMMMGVRSDGAAAKDILDEERCPAGGSSVLAWLSLLLLAGRLHLFSFDATLRLRRRVSCLDRRGYILARGGCLGATPRSRSRREIPCQPLDDPRHKHSFSRANRDAARARDATDCVLGA